MDYGGRYFLCAQYILHRLHQMVALGELLALISMVWLFNATQLRKHNSENKILIRFHIVWLLDFIFSQRATREAMLDCFPSDNRRRKAWEDTCGRIKLHKNLLLFSLHFSPDAFESFSRPQLLKELMNG